MLTTLANTAWFTASLASWRGYRRALRHPAQSQQQLLDRYLRTNAQTAFGRTHQFHRIRTIANYQSAVPLSTYDDLAPFIARIRAGEPHVLTQEPVSRFVPSSGSTSARKLIPYTPTLHNEFRRGIAPWIAALFHERPHLMDGPAYWSVSPVAQPAEAEVSAVPIGFVDDTAYLARFARRAVDSALAVPSIVRHIPDIASFRYVTLLFLLRARGLRLISIWHPSFLMLLLGDLAPQWDRLLGDIAQGDCRPPIALPPAVARALGPRLTANPRRARDLARCTPSDPQSLWPRLGLISCWADGHAHLHIPAIQRVFPSVAIQPKGLIATEGFVTLPLGSAMPLAIRSHFFEFLADDGRALLAHELVPGQTCSVVLTTGGGLYRYRLEDRVIVEASVGATPSLRFVGKEDHTSDLVGEKLSEGFVATVIQRLCANDESPPHFALLAPGASGGTPSYTLFIEMETPHHPALAPRLEVLLAENPHYRYARALGQLAPARIFRISTGAIESFLTRPRPAAARLGDIKPSPLSRLDGWAEFFEGQYVE